MLHITSAELASQYCQVFGCGAATPGRDPDHILTMSEAGAAILGALIRAGTTDRAEPMIQHLPLSTITVADTSGRWVLVPASGLSEHPLLSKWIAANLGDAVGDLLRAGAICTQITPGAPRYVSLDVRDEGGEVRGAVLGMALESGGVTYCVSATYGSAPKMTAWRSVGVSVDAVIGLGSMLTLAEDAPLPSYYQPPPAEISAVPPTTLH